MRIPSRQWVDGVRRERTRREAALGLLAWLLAGFLAPSSLGGSWVRHGGTTTHNNRETSMAALKVAKKDGFSYTVLTEPDYVRATSTIGTDNLAEIKGYVNAAAAAGARAVHIHFPHVSKDRAYYLSAALDIPRGLMVVLTGAAPTDSDGNYGTVIFSKAPAGAITWNDSLGATQKTLLFASCLSLQRHTGAGAVAGTHGWTLINGLDAGAVFDRCSAFGWTSGAGFYQDTTYNVVYDKCWSKVNRDGFLTVGACSATTYLWCNGISNDRYNIAHTGAACGEIHVVYGDYTTGAGKVNSIPFRFDDVSNLLLDHPYTEHYSNRTGPMLDVNSALGVAVTGLVVRGVLLSEQVNTTTDVPLVRLQWVQGATLDAVSFSGYGGGTTKKALQTDANCSGILVINPKVSGSASLLDSHQSATSFMSIRNGRVGLGTLDPTIAIHAKGAAIQNMLLECTAGKAWLFRSHTDGNLYFRNNTDGVDAFIVSPTGAVTLAGTLADASIPATIARDTEVTAAVDAHVAAADPHAQYQRESEKGAANGYASLGADGTVPLAQRGACTQTLGAAVPAFDVDVTVPATVKKRVITFLLRLAGSATVQARIYAQDGVGGAGAILFNESVPATTAETRRTVSFVVLGGGTFRVKREAAVGVTEEIVTYNYTDE